MSVVDDSLSLSLGSSPSSPSRRGSQSARASRPLHVAQLLEGGLSYRSPGDMPSLAGDTASLSSDQPEAVFRRWSSGRRHIYRVTQSRPYAFALLAVIAANAATVVLETDRFLGPRLGWLCDIFSSCFLGVYLADIVLRLYGSRMKFVVQGWNLLDFIALSLSLLEWLRFLPFVPVLLYSPRLRLFSLFRLLLSLRCMRLLHNLRGVRHLNMIVQVIAKSIPAMGASFVLLAVTMYMFSIAGVVLFSLHMPNHFGTLGRALFSVLQLITLDDWSDFYGQQTLSVQVHVGLVVFLVVVILFESFVFVTFFIAILINNFEFIWYQTTKHLLLHAATTSSYQRTVEGRQPRGGASSVLDGRITGNQRPLLSPAARPRGDVRVKERVQKYFQLLQALDSQIAAYDSYNHTLDVLVDAAFRTGEDTELVY